MARVFFSYRRSDTIDTTKRIYRQFEKSFGLWRYLGAQRRNLFLDKDNIMPNGDFRAQIQRFIIQSDHMLVIIGDTWLEEIQRRQASNEADFVLIEIESAFIHKVNIIPVLVHGATMPSRDELPDEIKQLATQHAHQIRDDYFHEDTKKLIGYTRPAIFFHSLNVLAISLLIIVLGFFSRGMLSNNDDPQLTPGTQVAGQATNSPTEGISDDDARATGTAQAYSTLTALAPTNTPTITPTPSDTPISSSDIQQTAQAEVFATETDIAGTQAVIAQETQNSVLTEQFIAGSTATYIAQLSLTPPATDTPLPTVTPTSTPLPTETLTPTLTNTPLPTETLTPTLTNTPLPTETLTNTPIPPTVTDIPIVPTTPDPFSPVTRNDDWTPIERDFDGVTMVLVPAGQFVMGSTDSEIDFAFEICPDAATVFPNFECRRTTFLREAQYGDNTQIFTVPFWIDKFEVSNEQYGSTSFCTQWSSEPEQPHNCTSWFQAENHCEMRDTRLPTEAEWEFAARGPDGLIYPWGNDFIGDNVVYFHNFGEQVAPVGSRPNGASWVGALDMSGNVDEWTNSLYESYPYDATDGREADTGLRTDVYRVSRGNDFIGLNFNLRSAYRGRGNPNGDYSGNGFRCVRSYN